MFTINSQKPETRQGSGRGLNVPDIINLFARDNVIGLYPRVKAQGKMTLALNPSNSEAFIIGGKTYTFQTTLTNNDGNIKIGGTLAETKANVVAAINLTGQPGTQYALATRVNEKVTIADFIVNDAIITAKEAGTIGNSIATTETMAGAGNQFDAATLGTYRLGEDYTNPDITYSAQGLWADTNGSGWARTSFNPDTFYQGQYRQNKPFINRYWPASGFSKITIPDSFGNKIKRVETLGMSIAQKVNEVLTTTTSHANNNVYKIIEIATNKGVVQYFDGTASQVYLMAFTIDANGAITGGTPVSMNSMNNSETECDIVKIDTDKFLVSYKDTGATNFPKCAVGTVSTVTITMAAGVQPVATATTETKLIPLNTNKALLAFNGVNLYAVSISVTTPSYGTVQAVTGATAITMVQNGVDKFQLAYSKSSAAFTLAGTVATLAITLGTEVRVTNGNIVGAFNQHKLLKVATDKVVYLSDQTDSGQQKIECDTYFFTISGTTTSIVDASFSGQSFDSIVEAELIDTTKILVVKASTEGTILDVDLVKNRVTSRVSDTMHDVFCHSDNDRQNGLGYIGSANVRWAKIGNFIVAMSRQGDFQTKLQYFSFPVSLSIEVYLNDEYVKTIVHDKPMMYAPLVLNLDVDGYGAAIKLKNPNAVEMLIYPETEGQCGSMVLE